MIKNNFEKLRLEYNLSINELSNLSGISVYILKKAEKNKNSVKSKNLIILAEFYKVSTDFLLEYRL